MSTRASECVCLQIIDKGDQLERLRELLDAAVLACIDCEWVPHGPPAATLLQLAVLTLDKRNDVYERHIVIVDVLELIQQGHRPELCRLVLDAFTSETLLKLAHSLTNDASALLRAAGLPLEHHGVINNGCDVRPLMTRLCARGSFKHAGLSCMLAALTGFHLEKEMQVSDWATRPLTEAQLMYAAADASCLVDLFLVGVRLHRHRDGDVLDQQRKNGQGGCYEVARVPRWIDASDVDPELFTLFGQSHEYRNGRWRVVDDTASAFWGAGTRQKKTRKKSLSGVRGAEKPSNNAVDVPWDEPSGAKFVADEMCVGCSRELRLFGVDVECVSGSERLQRHVIHRHLVDVAESDGRVILTRDSSLVRRRLSSRCYFVHSDDGKRQQAEEVMRAFGLLEYLDRESLMTRCSQCNGALRLVEELGELPAGSIPAAVLESVDEFWICSKDEHVYWQGGQYARSLERLMGQLDTMKL